MQTLTTKLSGSCNNYPGEFGLDPLISHKSLFSVKKNDVSPQELENIELLDQLLSIRSNEIEDDIICELDKLIFDICTK